MNIIQYNILILFYFKSYISQNYLIFYKILTKDTKITKIIMLEVINLNLFKFCKDKNNKHLAIFSAKIYDYEYFLKIN